MKSRKDIIIAVASSLGVSQSEAAVIVKTTLKSLQDVLKVGDGLQIKDFGTFKVASLPERVVKSNFTGENITVPAKNVVKFKASSNWFE